MLLSEGEKRALIDPHVFASYTGVVLRGISVTRKPDGWQAIFRGTTHQGIHVYCLAGAVDFEQSLALLFDMVGSKGGERYWYPDKFAKQANLKVLSIGG